MYIQDFGCKIKNNQTGKHITHHVKDTTQKYSITNKLIRFSSGNTLLIGRSGETIKCRYHYVLRIAYIQ